MRLPPSEPISGSPLTAATPTTARRAARPVMNRSRRYCRRVMTPSIRGPLAQRCRRWGSMKADDATVGEVVVRGSTVTPGYWRDDEATREAFKGGWFHTGDLGTIDGRGYVHLVDRAKDVILTGGETVYSTEVENVLYEHPGVREAAVFGVPDDTWGESVRAAVVTGAHGTVSAAGLIAFCRERLAGYKFPRVVDQLEGLSRTC